MLAPDISQVRVVQSYNLQPTVMRRYKDTMQGTNDQVKKRAMAIGFASGFAAFMMFATYSLVRTCPQIQELYLFTYFILERKWSISYIS
jgi:hypothetical protein